MLATLKNTFFKPILNQTQFNLIAKNIIVELPNFVKDF
jgi:hypothetical protein